MGPGGRLALPPAPARVALSHAPRGGARPPHQHRPCSVALASRGRTPSVLLSVCPSASVRSPSAASRGRALVCLASGPAAVPIRCPFRRRLSVAAVACWTRGSSRDLPPPPPRRGPPLRCARPSAGRVPGLAHRGPVAVSSPAGVPRPSGAGVTAGRRGRASAVRGVALAVVESPPGRAGSRWGGGGCGGGGRGGSAALSLPLLGPPRGGGGALRPSWTESVRAIGRPRRGAGRGARPGLPAGRAPSRHPPLPPGSLASRVFRRACRVRGLSAPPRFPGTPGSSCSRPYLVDPASSICLSQRLSHACLSTHGRYSETANGSLNQLWFLWSLAPLLLG